MGPECVWVTWSKYSLFIFVFFCSYRFLIDFSSCQLLCFQDLQSCFAYYRRDKKNIPVFPAQPRRLAKVMVRALDPVFPATLTWLRCSHAKLIARLGYTTATWLTITYTARSLAETDHVHFFIQTMLGYNHNREERRSDHISESPAPAYCRPLSSRPVVLMQH